MNSDSIRTVTWVLDGPMQAWSPDQRKTVRPTQDHPTKSGVLGLVANALGIDRNTDTPALSALKMAVREDHPGVFSTEFHTAGGGTMPLLGGDLVERNMAAAYVKMEKTIGDTPWFTPHFGSNDETTRGAMCAYAAPRKVTAGDRGQPVAPIGGRTTIPGTDHYLAGARFTVALTGAAQLIDAVAVSLNHPARTLYLGRKAYPCVGDPQVAVSGHTDPAEALSTCPGRMWSDTPLPGGGVGVVVTDVPDGPVSARTFTMRIEYSSAGIRPPDTQKCSAPHLENTSGDDTPADGNAADPFFTPPQEHLQ